MRLLVIQKPKRKTFDRTRRRKHRRRGAYRWRRASCKVSVQFHQRRLDPADMREQLQLGRCDALERGY